MDTNTAQAETTPAPVTTKKTAKRPAKKAAKKSARKAAKSTNGVKRLTKAEIKAANPSGKCLCGCGKVVSRRFLQGHDAQLHGTVLEAFKAEKTVRVSKATAEYLKTAPWMDAKLAKVIRS